jgi:hypothetical protein
MLKNDFFLHIFDFSGHYGWTVGKKLFMDAWREAVSFCECIKDSQGQKCIRGPGASVRIQSSKGPDPLRPLGALTIFRLLTNLLGRSPLSPHHGGFFGVKIGGNSKF